MASANYSPAPEVEKIAGDLIDKYHSHLNDFSVKMRYAFVDKVPKSKGKPIWGTCKKITGLNAFLSNKETEEPYFTIIIPEPIWDILNHDKKIALVDYCLCMAGAEANQKEDSDGGEDVVKLSLLPYDCETYHGNVRRHGLWQEEVEELISSKIDKKDEPDE